jgi:hypothetical protein
MDVEIERSRMTELKRDGLPGMGEIGRPVREIEAPEPAPIPVPMPRPAPTPATVPA